MDWTLIWVFGTFGLYIGIAIWARNIEIIGGPGAGPEGDADIEAEGSEDPDQCPVHAQPSIRYFFSSRFIAAQ